MDKLNVQKLDGLFDLMPLGGIGMPVFLAIALPGAALRALPGFPQAALPRSGRMASGRGFTPEAAKASALGEAAELASCCAWGDEKLVHASEAELGPAALSPEALNGWTKAQINDRTKWNAQYAGFDWRPALRDKHKPIDWISVENAFGGPPAYVPADFAYIGRRQAGDPGAVAIGDSNGCATGPTLEAAKLAAILELVERDATGKWWHGGQSAPVELASLTSESGILAWLNGRLRRTFLFDITTDIAIPVFAAASAEPDGSDVALGFAARIEPQAAAVAALSEMLQMEFSLNAARAIGEAAGNWAVWRTRVSMATAPLDAALKLAPEPIQASRLPRASSQLAAALAACAGIDLHFADMTRPEIGVPAVRMFSTALCHCKPRFERKRLFAGAKRSNAAFAGGIARHIPLLI